MKESTRNWLIGIGLVLLAIAGVVVLLWGCSGPTRKVSPDVTPTPQPALVSMTQTPTPTARPVLVSSTPTPAASVTPTPQPSSAPITGSLKYDETGCDPSDLAACRNPGQSEFVAVFVRNIQSGDRTLTDGIVAIQQLATVVGVETWDAWEELEVDPVNPTFVWCPGGCTWVPDTAFPLLGIEPTDDDYTIGIVQAHAPADPPAGVVKIVCPEGDCWAVALH